MIEGVGTTRSWCYIRQWDGAQETGHHPAYYPRQSQVTDYIDPLSRCVENLSSHYLWYSTLHKDSDCGSSSVDEGFSGDEDVAATFGKSMYRLRVVVGD